MKGCPVWTCLLLGVRVSEATGCSGGESDKKQDNCEACTFDFSQILAVSTV